MRILFWLVALAAAGFGAQDTGVIAGQVIDGVTGKPIAGAIVSIGGSSLVGVPAASQPPKILTAADGRFVFRDLAPGVFSVVATKGGYAEGEPGRRRPGGTAPPLVISTTDRALDVTVPMWRYGAIAGTVIDEAGEPVVNLQVRALKRAAAGGARRFEDAGATLTDDRGMYRFGNLVPAEYIVVAAPPPVSASEGIFDGIGMAGSGNTRLAVLAGWRARLGAVTVDDAILAVGQGSAVPAPAGARVRMYPPTFYPSSAAPQTAATIRIATGEERAGIDLQMLPSPSVRVAGTVIGNDGAVASIVSLQLVPDGTVGVPSLVVAPESVSDRSGRFIFAAVAPGRYSLRGQARGGPTLGQAWIETPLTVGDADIDGLVAMMRPPLRVTGRQQFDGNSPPPDKAPSGFTTAPFALIPLEGTLDRMSIAAMFEAQGFTLAGYLPGRYRVNVVDAPRGWMFKAAMLNGVDVSETPFDLTRDVADLTLVYTDRWSGLSGHVGDDADRAVVLLFTADTQAWAEAGPYSRRFRTARANVRGEFGMTGVPPGEYYVAAVPEEASADWRDPAMLDTLARMATRITILEGESKRVDLRLTEVRR